MKLAIIGSRTFNDYDLLETWADSIFYMQDTDSKVVVSGGASGADSLAERYTDTHIADLIKFPAEWGKYGKSAGFIRNQTIVDNCDMVLAFWDGVSRGTADTIEKAKKAKKPTFIIYFDKPKPTPEHKHKMKGL